MTALKRKITNRYKNGKRMIGSKILVLIIVAVTAFNFLAPMAGLSDIKAEIDPQSLLELHNRERAKLGLDPLTINPNLNSSAHEKAQAMIRTDCWSHYCPPGTSPWVFFEEADYEYLYAG